MLVKAAGTLYDIQIGKLETSMTALKEVGEDRNAIIHGLLAEGNAGVAAFRTRGRDIEAKHARTLSIVETAGAHSTIFSVTNADSTAASLTRCLLGRSKGQ